MQINFRREGMHLHLLFCCENKNILSWIFKYLLVDVIKQYIFCLRGLLKKFSSTMTHYYLLTIEV